MNINYNAAFWWTYLDSLNQSYKRPVTAAELAERLPFSISDVRIGLDDVVLAGLAEVNNGFYTSNLWKSERERLKNESSEHVHRLS